jgi:micrococcal nuclease
VGARRHGWWRGLALLALAPLALIGDCGNPAGVGGSQDGPSEARATVIDVVDGDTIEVRLAGGDLEDVRYIGIDTPESVDPDEPVQCFGHRASAVNEALVEGREVTLRFGPERRDAYGRLLAYVYVGGRLVNSVLVRRGLARTLTISPNDALAPFFSRLAGAAGRAGRGLWSAC